MKIFLFLFFSFLVLPCHVFAAAAVVQSVSVQSSGPIGFITTGNITTTTGNLIVCDAARYEVTGTDYVTTDNKGNTLTFATPSFNSTADTAQQQRQRYQQNAAGGAGHNFTLTSGGGGADYLALACTEISGVLTTGALDQISTKVDNTGTTGLSSGTTPTTTQANEIVCGAGSFTSAGGIVTATIGGGFTQNQNMTAVVSPNTVGMVTGCKVVSATGTQEFLFSIDSAAYAINAAVATYKATGGAPAVVRRRGVIQW